MKNILLVLLILLTGCSKQPILEDEPSDNDRSNFEYESNYEENIYQWIVDNQLDNGLVRTTEISDYISLYDNALAAIVFSIYEDYDNAEAIFDFFDARIDTELNDEYGGFAQFRKPSGEIYDAPIGRRWLGDNAWLLIALNFYHEKTSSETYQTLTDNIENYIRGLQREDGGLDSGLDPSGRMMAPVTEAMIDSFSAIDFDEAFHNPLIEYLDETRYDYINKVYKAWPGNPDYEYALDVSSYGYLSWIKVDDNPLEFADERFLFTLGDITGYCADEDLDAIFIEHSLQMATAYVAALEYEKATTILTEMEKTIINDEGFPYATNSATNYGTDMLW